MKAPRLIISRLPRSGRQSSAEHGGFGGPAVTNANRVIVFRGVLVSVFDNAAAHRAVGNGLRAVP